MQKANSLREGWRIAIFFVIAFLVIAADQLTKQWVKAHIPLWGSIPETGFFRISHVENTGSAFGLFQGQRIPLIIIASVGVVVILLVGVLVARRFSFLRTRQAAVSMGLLLGGTCGNLIERIQTGLVTDFIYVGPWPSFNIADSSVVIGVILLAYILLFQVKT